MRAAIRRTLIGKNRHRLFLDKEAELKRFADQIEINMRDLKPALRHGLDKAFRFKARDQFADSAERQARHGDELALRNELARMKITRQQMLGEALISLVPQFYRFVVIFRQIRSPLSFQAYAAFRPLLPYANGRIHYQLHHSPHH